MRRDYKALLLAILTFAFIITSGFLLFGTIDATQVDPPACEQQFKLLFFQNLHPFALMTVSLIMKGIV